jgi:hypothetical protein
MRRQQAERQGGTAGGPGIFWNDRFYQLHGRPGKAAMIFRGGQFQLRFAGKCLDRRRLAFEDDEVALADHLTAGEPG